MTTKIKLIKHVHYGRERLYPNCPLSTSICMIMGGKTLSQGDVDILARHGNCEFKIEIVKDRPGK